MSQLTISGAVSGVDTASIINSLVTVQQNQQRLIATQQAKQQKAADAFGSLISALGDLGSQASAIAATSAWKGATTSSSSTGVTATSTGNVASSITFDVVSLAKAHTVISANTVNGLGATVADGPLTITASDGSTKQIDTGSGSLSDVVAAVNGSSAGLVAAAVKTGPNAYRLQIGSATKGFDSQFAVDGLTGLGGLNVLRQGADAEISVGEDPDTAYSVTSADNTFTDLVPGLSFTVSQLESGVTVSSSLDGSTVAADVQKLVDTANSVLGGIAATTTYDAAKKTGGALVGDSTVRSIQQGILNLVSGSHAPGVSLTRDGRLAFNKTAFTTAFVKDPAAVAAKFGAGSTFQPVDGVTGTVSLGSATSATRAGTYAVNVTSAATAEQWELPGGPLGEGSTVTLSRGDQQVSYTMTSTDTLDDVVTELNRRASDADFGITAQLGGRGVLVTADSPGSGSAFTLSVNGTDQTQVNAGSDVQGSIDGHPATGVGNVLSLNSTDSRANGLSLIVSLSADDLAAASDVGFVTFVPGLAQKLAQFVQTQTQSGSGTLVAAQTGRTTAVKSLQDQIDSWDARLASYRATLQTQFTAMETAIAKLKSMQTSLGLSSSSSSSSTSSSSSG